MTDSGAEYRGTKLLAYRNETDEGENAATGEVAEVARWKARIRRAKKVLHIEQRLAAARLGDKYLINEQHVRPSKDADTPTEKAYMPYLLPMLQDSHRRTLPTLPIPDVEATDEIGEYYADMARELVRKNFRHRLSNAMRALRDLQWDDDRHGGGVMKAVWRMKYDLSQPAIVTEPELLLIAQEAAEAENADPLGARLTDSDMHGVHAEVHTQAMMVLDPETDEYRALVEHNRQHMAEQVEVRQEWVRYERVAIDKFLYDPDVSWDERGWEAELVSMRILDMSEMGWKNLNPENLPPEVKPGEEEGDRSWQDMTALTWHIHDRRTGELLIVPQGDRDEGLFLARMDWPYEEIDIYRTLAFNDWQPDQEDGLPLIPLCIPILDNLADIDDKIRLHRKKHVGRKTIFPKGTLSKPDKAMLNDPAQSYGELAMDALAQTAEIGTDPIPATLLQDWERNMGMLRKLVGADNQDEGAPNPHAITAQESMRRGESADSRRDERQERLGGLIEWMGENTVREYAKFATKSLMLRLVGAAGLQPQMPAQPGAAPGAASGPPTSATEATEPAPMMPTGPSVEYEPLDPSNLPATMEYHVDLASESETIKAVNFEMASRWADGAMAMGYPLDPVKWCEFWARLGNIHYPERFRMDTPEPMMDGELGGQPGMPNDQPDATGQPNIPFPQQQTA